MPQNSGPNADVKKIKSVVCEDFTNYPENVKKELAGADACIWYENPPSPKPFKPEYEAELNKG